MISAVQMSDVAKSYRRLAEDGAREAILPLLRSVARGASYAADRAGVQIDVLAAHAPPACARGALGLRARVGRHGGGDPARMRDARMPRLSEAGAPMNTTALADACTLAADAREPQQVLSSDGVTKYTLAWIGGAWRCECKAAQRDVPCRHLREAEAQWRAGQVQEERAPGTCDDFCDKPCCASVGDTHAIVKAAEATQLNKAIRQSRGSRRQAAF